MTEIENAALYSRLSQLDVKGGKYDVSNSIENQMEMLQKYTEEKGWKVYNHYIDDDVSGTTFDRPGFNVMMDDIRDGKIDCVITKDLSRFGRNYLEAGANRGLLQALDVRYIAAHDGHDSQYFKETHEFDIATVIKEVVNEMYAADVSRKVRYTKKHLGSQGKFCNSRAPYGYWKSKDNKHVLLIDNDVAQNVVRVFDLYIAGKTARAIADIFNSEGITTPNVYYYKKVNKPNPYTKNKNVWGSASVMNIIRNPVYYGVMANGKRAVVSYKNNKRIKKPESEWIIIEDTHEPIISKSTWDEAQLISTKNKRELVRRNSDGEVSVFAGLIKCADCGGNMVFNRKKYKNNTTFFFRCSTYSQKGKKACSAHNINYDVVFQAVLADLKRNAALAVEDEQKLIDRILKENEAFKAKNISRYEKSIRESKNRIDEIDKHIQVLFEQRVSGETDISDFTFKRMVSKYEEEQHRIMSELEQLHGALDECKRIDKNLTGWIKKVRDCFTIDTITRAIAVELIEEIVVSEKYEDNGEQHIDVSILYKFGIQKMSSKT